MANDIFALWDENKTRINDITDIYTKNKFLLTRNQADARKSYQQLLERYKFSDMSDYVPSSGILKIMPKYSFFLQFRFFLATPYISRDDEEFYICDNPIKKDKVFKVPMVSGSSWKGNMRWTAMKIFTDGLPEVIDQNSMSECFDTRARMVGLFGHEKVAAADYLDSVLAEAISEDDKSHKKFIENKKFVKENFKKFLIEKDYINTSVDGRRGRLNFYPTFFNQISLEVINPHDRTTKAGTLPIYIESVPIDADGIFSLLYIPFDLMGKPEDKVKKEVAEDLELIRITLKKMILTYGFSAKKSSGFGIAKNELSDAFCEMKGIEIEKSPKKAIKQEAKSMSFEDFKAMDRNQRLKKMRIEEQKTFDNLENKIKAIITKLLNTASTYSGGNNV